MIKRIKHIASLLTLICLTSCEGMVGGDGYIYDSQTKTPLKNVQVVLFLNDRVQDTCYSNKNGFFRGSDFVGCVPTCPCAKIVLTKDSFKTLTLNFDDYWKKKENSTVQRDSVTIYLERNL